MEPDHGPGRQALIDLTRLQQRVTELRLRVLSLADSLDVGADSGCTSTAAWLADRTHVTRARAHADVALARSLARSHAATRDALAAGALHEDQARVVVAAVEDLPDEVSATDRRRAEQHLVALAREYDAKFLRRLGRRVFEVIAPDEADRRRARRSSDRSGGTATHVAADARQRRRHLVGLVPDPRPARRDAPQGRAGAERPRQHRTATPDAVATLTTAGQLGAGFTRLLERFPVDLLPRSGGVNASVVVTMTFDQLRSGLGAAGIDTGEWISAGEARRQPPRRLPGVSRQADIRTTLQRGAGGGEGASIAAPAVNGERQPVPVAAVPGGQPSGAAGGPGGSPANDAGNGHSHLEPPAPTPFRPPPSSPLDDDLDIPDFLK